MGHDGDKSRLLDPRWYLAIPLFPKLLIAILAVGMVGAFAQGNTTQNQAIDYSAELFAMVKAAGVVGTIVLLMLLRDARKQHAEEKAELYKQHAAALEKAQQELDEKEAELRGWRERSLTALINFNTAVEDQSQVNKKMVESIGTLISWLKHREGMPPAE